MRLGSILLATEMTLTWASGHRNHRYNGSVHFQKLIWELNDTNKFRNVLHLGQWVDIHPSPPPTRIFYHPKGGRGGTRSIKRALSYSCLAACGLSNANLISRHTSFWPIPRPLHTHHQKLACFSCAELCHVLFLSLATGLSFSPLFLFVCDKVTNVGFVPSLFLYPSVSRCLAIQPLHWPSTILC